ALGGLAMSDILRAEAAAGAGSSHKSVIMIFLPGGPPHQDMYDLKPDAPSEVRGEFRPIKTNVPGIEICELMPRLAGMMDKLVPIRTIVGATGDHYSFQCMTGRDHRRQPQGGWPELGSVVARLQGSTSPAMPAYVGLSPKMQHFPYNSGKPGFLGPAYAPFQPNGEGKDDLVLQGVSLERLGDRRGLVTALDHFNRAVDASGMMEGVDAFQQQALGVLTSSKLAAALDLEQEPKALRDRYGYGTPQHQGDGAPRLMQQFLMARRLVEAGVRCVTVSFSFWDYHGSNFKLCRDNLPALDQGVSALVEDLHQRGLDRDVSVVVWGEFGRTPKINAAAGRDHWPNVSCALLAGGGLRTGQAIGATDRSAAEAKDRPVRFEEVFSTLYQRLGIDAQQRTVVDLGGRPQFLVDHYPPIRELI
ncbi:MAG TPA: DUF1501 domain-containing protein, partial [Pirellulales bacterium]|nr:DUF1501 domain-containing protein [Pirellulales bacterium]